MFSILIFFLQFSMRIVSYITFANWCQISLAHLNLRVPCLMRFSLLLFSLVVFIKSFPNYYWYWKLSLPPKIWKWLLTFWLIWDLYEQARRNVSKNCGDSGQSYWLRHRNDPYIQCPFPILSHNWRFQLQKVTL